MDRVNVWNTFDAAARMACMDFAEGYKSFLSTNKTERECVDFFVSEAEKNGYIPLSDAIAGGRELTCGDRIYSVWQNKSMVMFEIGSRPLSEGLNIIGAHIDSPRLDVKQNPLYEDCDIAYFDTHYYGGIKKYQYVTMPLAIHGVVVKKSGETAVINIGEEEEDPVFFVSDLLIHLAGEQMKKPGATVVEGEALDIVVGSRPISVSAHGDKESGKESGKKVREMVLSILKDQYGIEEEDFQSAELEIVPAGRARDAGFDRSMVLGYGQDDKVCAYPAFRAQTQMHDLSRTSCTLLVDKEEIGSVGATGMRSRFFGNALAELMNLCGCYSELALRRALANSLVLSSDVGAAFDPLYASSFEKKNTACLGAGLALTKFTGSRGKSGANDANAEYIAHLRSIFDREKVCIQTAELGKVDAGGGGTIAYILSLYGMNVIDSGVPVLSMHSPWEAVSKADLYEAFRGYRAFLRDAGSAVI